MKKLFNSKAKIILISVISLLLIAIITGFWFYIKINTDQSVVKLDMPEITDKQKGTIIEISIPYLNLHNNETLMFFSLAGETISKSKLLLLPNNKVLNIVAGKVVIFDFKKKIAITNN